jgi:hypothetical protein
VEWRALALPSGAHLEIAGLMRGAWQDAGHSFLDRGHPARYAKGSGGRLHRLVHPALRGWHGVAVGYKGKLGVAGKARTTRVFSKILIRDLIAQIDRRQDVVQQRARARHLQR